MGNVLISMDDDHEALLRQLAQKKYGGKKGALRMVVQEALSQLSKNKEETDEAEKRKFFEFLDKGLNFKYKMYKNRGELYD